MTSNAALARAPEDEFVGRTYRTADAINEKLKLAAASFNLVAPATRVGSVPEGCGVALSVVHIDPTVANNGSGPDCFRVDGGKLSPHRHVFDRIGAALGVVWNPTASGRVDDGKDARYCRYRAVGAYRDYSGQWLTIVGEYELDLRDGSDRVDELLEKEDQAKAKKSVRQMRKFIVQRAETGARTRAIAGTGFKRAYTPQELSKPFVVARLCWDGQTDDPELRRVFATETARAFLGGSASLYGAPAAGPALPAAAATPTPSNVVDVEADDDDDDDQDDGDAGGDEQQQALCLPDRDGTAIDAKADLGLLQRWERRIADDLADHIYPPSEIPEMEQMVKVIKAELARRAGGEKY